jgi:hypothetical protein
VPSGPLCDHIPNTPPRLTSGLCCVLLVFIQTRVIALLLLRLLAVLLLASSRPRGGCAGSPGCLLGARSSQLARLLDSQAAQPLAGLTDRQLASRDRLHTQQTVRAGHTFRDRLCPLQHSWAERVGSAGCLTARPETAAAPSRMLPQTHARWIAHRHRPTAISTHRDSIFTRQRLVCFLPVKQRAKRLHGCTQHSTAQRSTAPEHFS